MVSGSPDLSDARQVAESFAFDAGQVARLREQWLGLLDLCVWGDLKSAKIGAVPRLRKRMLEVGECFRSLVSDRGWIPRPREQVKSAMAASLNLRDALLNLDRAARLVNGGVDFERFTREILDFREGLLRLMEKHEMLWGNLLESQYGQPEDGDG